MPPAWSPKADPAAPSRTGPATAAVPSAAAYGAAFGPRTCRSVVAVPGDGVQTGPAPPCRPATVGAQHRDRPLATEAGARESSARGSDDTVGRLPSRPVTAPPLRGSAWRARPAPRRKPGVSAGAVHSSASSSSSQVTVASSPPCRGW